MTHWEVDPKTGDYIMVNGSPKETVSLTIPAYYRLKSRRGRWLHAPDAEYGSEFYLLKSKQANRKPAQVEDVAARAMQPIVDDGRADTIEVSTSVAGRGYIQLESKIFDATGTPETLKLEGV